MYTMREFMVAFVLFSINGVLSINEHAPVVQWPTFNVPESAPIGSLIGKCTITDADEPKGTLAGQTSIDFVNPTVTAANKWVLDRKSCEFYLNDNLDYAAKKVYNLNMQATDLDPDNPKTVQGTFTVNVLDTQNQPTCTEYLKVVPTIKNVGVGTQLTTVICADNDGGVNGQLTYELDASNDATALNLFEVNPTTGILSLKTLITSETIPYYEVLINVKDGGSPSMSNNVLVRVIVTDVPQDGVQPISLFNDVFSTPMEVLPEPLDTLFLPALPKSLVPGQIYCPRYALTAVIPETKTTNFFVYEFKCTEPSGNTPTFKIQRGNVFDKFKIEGSSLKLDKGLNADSRNFYHLRILVTDSTATFSTTVTIAARITGVNDNAPKFYTPNPTFEVSEDDPIGASVYTCPFNDKDKTTTPEGQLRFSWKNPNDPATKDWMVDPVTCSIYIGRKLDYVATSTYVLILQAVDLDPTSPKTSETTVTINIKDANEPPECSPINSTSINRDASATTQIATLSCSDIDTGVNGILGYKMDGGNGAYINSKFVVSSSGEVSLQSTIDDDIQPQYDVAVIVYDGGSPSLSTTVTVPVSVTEVSTTITTTPTKPTTTPTTTKTTLTTTTTTPTTTTTIPTTTTTTPSTTTQTVNVLSTPKPTPPTKLLIIGVTFLVTLVVFAFGAFIYFIRKK